MVQAYEGIIMAEQTQHDVQPDPQHDVQPDPQHG
jgi:hypothetical protein